MNAIENLKSVLCGPDGKCCIYGSQADLDIIDQALAKLAFDAGAKSAAGEPVARMEVNKNGGAQFLLCTTPPPAEKREPLTDVQLINSIKQECETGLVIGDEIGMRDALQQVLNYCNEQLGITV